MRKFIVQIAFVAVVVLVVLLLVFKRTMLFSMARSTSQMARGYGPAETPQKAVDGFRKAIANRDYEDAADVYLGGEYKEQMQKAAEGAKKIGDAIDALLGQMQVKDLDSDKVKFVLILMEPFPKDFIVPDVKKLSDERAMAAFVEAPKQVDFKGDPSWGAEKWDVSFYRALAGGPVSLNVPAELRYEGAGKDKAWKIYFPVTPAVRLGVDRLVAKHKTYLKVLQKLKEEVRTEVMTKADFEGKFRSELETAARD